MTYRLRPCADRSCHSAVGEPDRHVGPACSAQAHPTRHCDGSGSLWLWCSVRCPCAAEVARHRSLKTPPRCRLTNPRRATVLSRSTNINPLTPNDHYSGRTAQLTSKRCISYIYSTNTGTEYFKHGIYSPFFSLQNAVCFIILIYLVPVLFTFYIQGVLKLKK